MGVIYNLYAHIAQWPKPKNNMAALRGVKVLEFGGLAPVPYAGMILADFGASVTRIDKVKPTGLELMDRLGRGKRSAAIDLRSAKGVEIVERVSRNSDVLIEPFRPGVMEKLGLGPEILMKDNPKLIYARLTGNHNFLSDFRLYD